MFQHYLVTRFNLKSESQNGVVSKGPSEEWMEERFRIFLDFCYPSVIHQSNKKFLWLVFFDSDTSTKYRKIINKLSSESNIFFPVYINSGAELIAALKLEIKSRSISNYLITSRLDNDDCIHKDYVDSIQKYFHSQNYLAINFINGLTLKISDVIKCGYRIHANNPFISLIESTESNFDTVYCRNHGGWGKIKLIEQINNAQPLWITVTHQHNILNQYIGFGHVQPEMLEDFNIESNALKSITLNLSANSSVRSFMNMFTAYTHFYLKLIRNKLRGNLNLIPKK